jgi:ElaB/YqjD/DUF883 family membrane-anchored ribosome-binding protein
MEQVGTNIKKSENHVDDMKDKFDGIGRTVAGVAKEHASTYLGDVKDFAESGKEKAKEKYHELEDLVKNQSDTVIDYIKNQPVKSMLFALGAGYLLNSISKKA